MSIADTYQTVELASKAGKAFLRKIIRSNAGWREEWKACAYRGDDNDCIKFTRTIRGDVGEPDAEINVLTDARVSWPSDHRCGTNVQSFSDSDPVYVPRPRRVFVSGQQAQLLAQFLLDGAQLSVEASSGSTNSSRHGLAFLSLSATFPKIPYASATLGSESVYKDGSCIVCGVVQD